MRVATYNVNGVKARLPRLLEWLEETRPDVACLQEIKTGDATFPIEAIEGAGYKAVWHGQPRHHGVAVLASGETPVEIRRGLPGDETDLQARYLEVDVFGLRIASVYLPNGNPVGSPNYEYKHAWFQRFNAYAATLIADGRSTILAGNLNVVALRRPLVAWNTHRVELPHLRATDGPSEPSTCNEALHEARPGDADEPACA